MGLISKEVKIKPNSNNVNYYRNKGYSIPMKMGSNGKLVIDKTVDMIIKVEDLPKGSKAEVDILCDYCQETIIHTTYNDYNAKIKSSHKIKRACSKCRYLSYVETCNDKYGCDNFFMTEDFKTVMYDRHGVTNSMSLLENQIKAQNTNLDKYGVKNVFELQEFQDLAKQTILEKYGVENVFQSEEIKKKSRNSFYEKYGVEYPSQVEEIRQKQITSLYNNNTQKTSKQQKYINELYNGELNYPCVYYSLDIALLNDMIDCEIDFGGHNLGVKLGTITSKEFERKEIIRDCVVKESGYKIMRIVSRKDYLPSDEKLLELLSCARNFFKENPECSWIEFDIDNSIIRNALHKDGEFFNYGKLRKLPRKSA